MPLTQEQIQALVEKKSRPRGNKTPQGRVTNGEKVASERLRLLFPTKEQVGPVRRLSSDAHLTCQKTSFSQINGKDHYFRCGSPTPYKFQGVAYCSIHLIELANEMLVEKGVLS